jgi:hypothetical protein
MLTNEQSTVVNSDHVKNHIVIRAEAATGKTTTIIHKIYRLIKSNISDFVLLTYSKGLKDDMILKALKFGIDIADKIFTIDGWALKLLQSDPCISSSVCSVSSNGNFSCDLARVLRSDSNVNNMLLVNVPDYVFIDECQDINSDQCEIIKWISVRSTLILIGDPLQTIYTFRGSVPEYIMSIHKILQKKPVLVYKLSKNFRSTPVICNFCNAIRSMCILTDKDFCIREPNIDTYIEQTSNDRVNVINCIDHYNLIQKVLNIINTCIRKQLSVAVLTRTRKELSYIEELLASVNIDYHFCKQGDTVSLLTIHSSKGMEFDCVVILNFNSASFNISVERSGIFDVMCLWYVAASRAKKHLFYLFHGCVDPIIVSISNKYKNLTVIKACEIKPQVFCVNSMLFGESNRLSTDETVSRNFTQVMTRLSNYNLFPNINTTVTLDDHHLNECHPFIDRYSLHNVIYYYNINLFCIYHGCKWVHHKVKDTVFNIIMPSDMKRFQTNVKLKLDTIVLNFNYTKVLEIEYFDVPEELKPYKDEIFTMCKMKQYMDVKIGINFVQDKILKSTRSYWIRILNDINQLFIRTKPLSFDDKCMIMRMSIATAAVGTRACIPFLTIPYKSIVKSLQPMAEEIINQDIHIKEYRTVTIYDTNSNSKITKHVFLDPVSSTLIFFEDITSLKSKGTYISEDITQLLHVISMGLFFRIFTTIDDIYKQLDFELLHVYVYDIIRSCRIKLTLNTWDCMTFSRIHELWKHVAIKIVK